MQNIQANKKLNYSNERVYKGLIDIEPNAEEIIALAEQQELQKRKQAAKFLVSYLTRKYHQLANRFSIESMLK